MQSVAVRLLVEREREIQNFKPQNSFKVVALFTVTGKDGKKATMKAELPKNFATVDEAEAFLKDCQNANFTISDIEVKPAKKSPAAPFTTSTLQQEASRKLGYSVSRTMVIAQRLYEDGKITYMRTDSVNLSDMALAQAADTIEKQYGDKYVQVRKYKTKSSGAQEAHEAIRPTEVANRDIGGKDDEKRLYELIWKRTVASQMSDAELERTTARISISTRKEELVAKGEVVKFDGFLKVYFESTDDDQEEEQAGMLPPIEKGQDLPMQEMSATERFTRNPPRYTEASLVKKLEELGIGRPSTYAPTISTIQKRGYVKKEDRPGEERPYRVLVMTPQALKKETKTEIAGAEKSKLFPMDVGMIVTDFLMEHFPTIMDYNFTAEIEKEFDEIAEGGMQWDSMIGDFYKPFHKVVEDTLETAERVTGERELGTDPKTGKPIIARMGRYGPMVQLGDREDEKKKFAKLRDQQSIETITLEEALELFKLPRTLGEYEGSEVLANVGRFGPYIMHEKKFYSLKDVDPLDVTLEQAIETIVEQKKAAAKKTIKEFEEEGILILNGQYGPYIKANKRNYKIPKDKEAEALSLEECKEIIENAPPPKKRFSRRK